MAWVFNPFTGTFDAVGTINITNNVGGSNTQVQFNDSGAFGGDSGFTYDKATNALSLAGPLTVTPASDAQAGTFRRNSGAQTSNILEIQTEANAFLAGFDKSGILTLGAASTQTGTLKLAGTTSGVVTLSVADAAGTWTMKLPADAGTADYVLKTDGSGNTSWTAQTGGGGGITIDTTTITSGTAGRLLFESATNKVTESASLSWDDTNKILTLGVSGTSSGILKLANSTAAAFVQLTPTANATLQLGAADTAAPVAQTLQVQSVVAGTSNTAGTNFTIAGSKGTGTGAGGSLIFQVAPAGTTGTSQNALATALTINSSKQVIFQDGTSTVPSLIFTSGTTTGFAFNGAFTAPMWVANGVYGGSFDAGGLYVKSTGAIGFQSGTTPNDAGDLRLTRAAAATLQLGAADAAAPVAQTLQVQSVVAGTSNTAGTDWSIQGSRGTGTGAGGKIIFKTAPAGSTGTAQNAASSAWAIDSNLTLYPAGTLATNMTTGFINIPGAAGAASGTPGNTTGYPMYYDATNNKIYIYNGAWRSTAALT